MSKPTSVTLSVVVPLYNEGDGLAAFHAALIKAVQEAVGGSYEIIYCDDGSHDATPEQIRLWHKADERIKLLKFSRNFGKENALTAGIAEASGQAILMLDGDGQHPVALISKFVDAWQAGAKVVIGVRNTRRGAGWLKSLSSRTFYAVFNRMTTNKLVAGSTDFRLIDHSVQQAFLQLPETDRITRGLIDWLGFERSYITFEPAARNHGRPSYRPAMLTKLALNSFVSLTPTPLYLFGYVGVIITIVSFFLGLAVFIEQLLLSDPLHWKFTGTAMLSILLLFSVGIVLMSQGMLSLYVSHIHNLSKRRPLYVIDYDGSAGVKDRTHAQE